MTKPVLDAEIVETPHVIHRDRFDVRTFGMVRYATPELDAFCNERGEAGTVFATDIFSSLFKYQPMYTDDSPPHRKIIEEMQAMPEWAKFRETTRLDKLASAMGTVSLATTLASKLPKNKDGTAGINRPADPPTVETYLDKDGKPATKTHNPNNPTEAQLRQLLRKAVQHAATEVEEQMDAFGTLAGTEAGAVSATNLPEVTALFRRIQGNRMLRDIAKMAGRMKRLALSKHRERVRHGPDELADIETGRDLLKVLPSELAVLGTELELDFMRKYVEGSLLQYRMEGFESKGRGPIVMCLDSSGSMSGAREIWAKSIALGLLTIAAKEGRAFTLLTFGSSSELKRFDFPHRDVKPADVLAALEFSFNGGTDFNRPLGEALKLVSDAADRKLNKADIIFVTDGEANVSPDTVTKLQDYKKKSGLKMFTVLIGTTSRSLTPISDGTVTLSDLSKDAEALNLAFGV